MCGNRYRWARARATVPFPLAAGPSTAITRPRPALDPFPMSSAKPCALTGAYPYGKARRRTLGEAGDLRNSDWSCDLMVKPEWGTKRTCPKCSTRFYDLGHEDPVHCINCGTEWMPEP